MSVVSSARQPIGRPVPLMIAAAVMIIGGLYWFQANPRLWPIPAHDNLRAINATFAQLEAGDLATGRGGHQFSRDNALSDEELFREWWWTSDAEKPHQLTVGGAIAYQGPLTIARLKQEGAAQREREAQIRAHGAMIDAQQAEMAASQRLLAQREAAARAVEDAKVQRDAAASAATAVCNSARTRAYATASSEADYRAWVVAHPCTAGTQTGDGYSATNR